MSLLIQELQETVNFRKERSEMKMTEQEIDNLADKLLIGLSREENKMVLDEFSEIERNMNSILEIRNISNVEPLTHPFVLEEVLLREDEIVEELTQNEVLKNAEKKNLTSVIVPKVVK